MSSNTFHVAMLPWFAMGHITPFLHLSNRLADRGCRVSFFIPSKTQLKCDHLNLHPNLIRFIPLAVPHVEGLPLGVETMSDVPSLYFPLLTKAFDLTRDQVQIALSDLQPQAIFFDYAHWVPSMVHSLGTKCIVFAVTSAALVASVFVPAMKTHDGASGGVASPASSEPGDDMLSLYDRVSTSLRESDAICFRGYAELYGPSCDYIEKECNKQVVLIGSNLPEPSDTPLDERWVKWLGGFGKGSVVYCAFGSECVLKKTQFQELVLGLEQTGFPFLARLKPPLGVETVEEALPEGFEERVGGRGVVHGGWVQQQQILNHPSIGCFVSHCGYGSMWESLVTTCQLVLVPHIADHFANAKFMAEEVKVGVEVERREEDGGFTRDSVCQAVRLVMDEGSEVGEEVRANHQRWREFLCTQGLDSTYLDNFILKLKDIIKD